MIAFHVDPSWYENYWWRDSAPRKLGLLAFFRRIVSHPSYPFAAAMTGVKICGLTARSGTHLQRRSPDPASGREYEQHRGPMGSSVLLHCPPALSRKPFVVPE
jgi:hypothetical protein